MPDIWKSMARQIPVKDPKTVEDWRVDQLSVPNLLKTLGLPTRVQKRSDQLFMIYEFDKQYTFIVYLDKIDGNRCTAAALWDAKGELATLIK